jgi:hypothetical protein
MLVWFGFVVADGQVVTGVDPDSVMNEWLEQSEWEAVSLHPDIVMDWMLDMDSAFAGAIANRSLTTHMVTVSAPVGAEIFDWTADSGGLISPVSLRYRIRISEPKRWEFRMQANQNAGDTCFDLPDNGIPEHLSMGLLIRPGSIFREIIAGDFQVNSGFGAVAGSSPVFSVALGNPGSLHKPGKGIRLHSGTDEGRFLRGMAGNIDFGKSELLVFASGKDGIGEQITGFGWKRSLPGYEIGCTGIRVVSQFPQAVKEGWGAAWQPDSGRFSRLGLSGQFRIPFGIIFGEMGWSPAGGFGWITGIRWFEAHGFSAASKYSGCSPGYPVSYTFFQSGTGQTREGQRVITSFRYAPARQMEWLGSAEMDLSYWPGTNAHFNKPSTRISQQLKYTSENLWEVAAGLQFDFLESVAVRPTKLIWKMALDSDPKQSGAVRFRAGIRQQVQGFGDIISKGTTADCSISVVLAEKRIRITAGFRLFTVEAGTDPLYAYEPDVQFGWSAPVLSGSGTRWFATARCKILNRIDLEFKIGQTAYSDLKHNSEGNRGGVSGKVQVTFKIG